MLYYKLQHHSPFPINVMHKISTPQEMFTFWTMLAKEHKILLLEWDLWAGKTLLTKGFAKGLGINEHLVQSPTYAYLNIYAEKLLHIDMYRINHYQEVREKGIIEQINMYPYVVIERPKFLEYLSIPEATHIIITKISETTREINISKYINTQN